MCIGKIPLSAKGITDEITDNHPIDICSVGLTKLRIPTIIGQMLFIIDFIF